LKARHDRWRRIGDSLKEAGACLRQGDVELQPRYGNRGREKIGRERSGAPGLLLYARQFFKASRLRKAQQLMASCHAPGKFSAGRSALRALSWLASFRPSRSPLQIPSFTAQANRNSSWSPPASGCSFAKSSRHIYRSSRNTARSMFLAPAMRRTPLPSFSSILCPVKMPCKACYPATATLRRANPLSPPHMASGPGSRSYPVCTLTRSRAPSNRESPQGPGVSGNSRGYSTRLGKAAKSVT